MAGPSRHQPAPPAAPNHLGPHLSCYYIVCLHACCAASVFERGVGDFGQEEEPETFPTEGGTDQGDSSYNYLLGHWF